MSETTKDETIVSLLSKLRKEAEEIAGGWNGEDARFQVGGIVHTEEYALTAIEIVETCDKLQELLTEWN